MLKKGFTLQELLITLGILGVLAAVTMPGIMGLRPDKTKTMYMKAYNTLTTLTAEITDDPGLYYTTYTSDGTPNCRALSCTAMPLIEPYNTARYTGQNKFAYIFADKLNIQSEPNDLTGNGHIHFVTTDGTDWVFADNIDGSAQITINLNPNDSSNACSYDAANCKTPNEFIFDLSTDGDITPVDALGKAFLQNPTDMHSINEDRALADKLSN